MKKILIISGTVIGLMLLLPVQSHAQQQARSAPAKQAASDLKATRDIKVISSAGARALADACTAWAEQNKKIVAMAILDWECDRHRAVEGKVGLALAAPLVGDQQDGPERREFGADLHARLPTTRRASYRRQQPSHWRDGRIEWGR